MGRQGVPRGRCDNCNHKTHRLTPVRWAGPKPIRLCQECVGIAKKLLAKEQQDATAASS